jgi:site-specific DNA recombinase
MRWNDESTWTWSLEPVHEALVARADFDQTQEVMQSSTRARGPRSRHSGPRTYLLRGRLTCNICGRLMQGHEAHGRHYYRCRYTSEYAQSAALPHPLNVYLREDDLLPQIDEWLADLFSPDRLDSTLDLLLEPEPDARAAAARRSLEAQLSDCDRKTSRYRALLDEGVEPALVAEWLKEVTATRRIAERRLADVLAQPRSPFADRDTLWKTLVDLGGMSGVLASGDRHDRALFYEAVGITGLYKPHDDQVILSTSPRGHMVRVEGGT